MTAAEILSLVRPSVLVMFELGLRNASGDELVAAGRLAAIELQRSDSWGTTIVVYDAPAVGRAPAAFVSESDLAGKIRPVTADEERVWVAWAAGESSALARTLGIAEPAL